MVADLCDIRLRLVELALDKFGIVEILDRLLCDNSAEVKYLHHGIQSVLGWFWPALAV